MAQSKEDEPTLFMVSAPVLSDVPNSKSTKVTDDITAPVSIVGEGSIHPKEDHMAQLGSQFS